MILLIDNFDSFTYNLVQYLGELGGDPKVIRNNEMTVEDIKKMAPSHIVISPGPGRPSDAGISKDVITALGPTVPVLGVCLGHQVIGEMFGGKITYANRIVHGKTSDIYHKGQGVFKALPSPFKATRYHSLVIAEDYFPDALDIIAETKSGTIMGVQHKEYPIHGIQFHPESILTDQGKPLLKNFLNMTN